MIRQNFLLVLAGLSLILRFANGQIDCVPRSVNNLQLLSNSTLSWVVSPEEVCEISHFRVNVYRGAEDYEIIVEEPWADLSFLPYCDTWIFTVRVVSLDMVSSGHTLITRVPMPPTADLSIKNISVSNLDGDLYLTYHVDDEFQSCADSFRVVVVDEEIDEAEDYYVTNNAFRLNMISPCVSYEFGVRAIYRGRPGEEGPLGELLYEVPPVRQGSPQLLNVDVTQSSAEITWSLETRSLNRCPIRKFFVDGGNYFNFSLDIEDQFDRKPIVVQLASLRPNSLYLMRVTVENSAGLSHPSVVGVQTLDFDPSL